MKLATLEDGTIDGHPVLVSRDLRWATSVGDLAPSLLQLIERWDTFTAELERRSAQLNAEVFINRKRFEPAKTAAPLPRAPQWLDGSTFPSHGARMVKAFGLSDRNLKIDSPLMYQGVSDSFLGAHTAMPLPSEEHGIDLEAELAVITAEVPMNSSSANCARHIRLLTLVDDVSLRNLQSKEMSLGFGMIHSKPTCVFSPVCVTPDELGDAWCGGKMHLTMRIELNGRMIGQLSGSEMAFTFTDLIAHGARTRRLSAGTIVGSGTFSNADSTRGIGCIAEKRALEMMEFGEPRTGWLHFGDRVRMEVCNDQGESIFGAIDHTFIQAPVPEYDFNLELNMATEASERG
jgi:fumarylacetoacetate (FAA) hydrolase